MVLNSVRTRLAQLVPHALSQLPATARVPAQRLFAQSKHVVNRMQPPPPDSELSAQLEWTFKADVHSAAALSASIASTMADRERYSLLVGKLYHVYAALEGALDSSSSPAVKQLWEAHGAQLRRAELLAADLREVDAWPPAPPSFETTCYLLALREAAADDEATGGARHPSPSPALALALTLILTLSLTRWRAPSRARVLPVRGRGAGRGGAALAVPQGSWPGLRIAQTPLV